MNIVKIPPCFKNNNSDWFYDKFIDIESNYSIDNSFYNELSNIDIVNNNLVCYIVYLILIGNTLIPKIEKPQNGLEFKNKGKNSRLDIYHAHLNNEMVLIWYLENKGNDELFLKIVYLKHPISYKSILKDIYNSEYGYSDKFKDYFKNLKITLIYSYQKIDIDMY